MTCLTQRATYWRIAACALALLAAAWACGGSTSERRGSDGTGGDGGAQPGSGGSGGSGNSTGTAGAPSGGSGPTGGAGGAGPTDCVWGGQIYQDGDSFPAGDGCNSCFCNNGDVGCTLMYCPSCWLEDGAYEPGQQVDTPDGCLECVCDDFDTCAMRPCAGTDGGIDPDTGADCLYQGQTYQHGDRFPAGDGCNSCTCYDGKVDCTQIACPPDAGTDSSTECIYLGETYQQGESFPAGDGCNTCFCDNGSVGCTLMLCPDGGPPIEVDPRVVDVWHFELPTGAIRWYQVALCDGGRARLWTSFNGGGEPDQNTPIEGTFEAIDSLTVQAHFDSPADGGAYSSLTLQYDPDLDQLVTIEWDPDQWWGGTNAVRLAPLSWVVHRLSCN